MREIGSGTCKGPAARGHMACCRNHKRPGQRGQIKQGEPGRQGGQRGVRGPDHITRLGCGKDLGSSLSEIGC